MVVDSLRAIVAEGIGVTQWCAKKCDCLGSWKRILEENRDEDEDKKHLAAKVLFSTNLRYSQLSPPTLWIPAAVRSGWKMFLADS